MSETQLPEPKNLQYWEKNILTINNWLNNPNIFTQEELTSIYFYISTDFKKNATGFDIILKAQERKNLSRLVEYIFVKRPHLKENKELVLFKESVRKTLVNELTILLVFQHELALDIMRKSINLFNYTGNFEGYTPWSKIANEFVAYVERIQKTAEFRALMHKNAQQVKTIKQLKLSEIESLQIYTIKRKNLDELGNHLHSLLTLNDIRLITIAYDYSLTPQTNQTPDWFINTICKHAQKNKNEARILSAIHFVRPDIDLSKYGIKPVKRNHVPGLNIDHSFITGPHVFYKNNDIWYEIEAIFSKLENYLSEIAKLCSFQINPEDLVTPGKLMPIELFEHARKRGELHILLSAIKKMYPKTDLAIFRKQK